MNFCTKKIRKKLTFWQKCTKKQPDECPHQTNRFSINCAALHEDIRQKFAHNTNHRTGRSKTIHRYRLFLGTVLKFKLF
ncbi:MAG: hypothetical protein B7X12_03260 [Halothiobacillus sp. 20-53-49]|nr:MAG: hypothetical protein B7X12_03260 [Halothiobacillus sp. 20-53-49]